MLIGYNRLLRAFAVAACLLAGPHSTQAAESRQIEITKDSDYFGFDLRTEKKMSPLTSAKAFVWATTPASPSPTTRRSNGAF